jgi:hypothetical protein
VGYSPKTRDIFSDPQSLSLVKETPIIDLAGNNYAGTWAPSDDFRQCPNQPNSVSQGDDMPN